MLLYFGYSTNQRIHKRSVFAVNDGKPTIETQCYSALLILPSTIHIFWFGKRYISNAVGFFTNNFYRVVHKYSCSLRLCKVIDHSVRKRWRCVNKVNFESRSTTNLAAINFATVCESSKIKLTFNCNLPDRMVLSKNCLSCETMHSHEK